MAETAAPKGTGEQHLIYALLGLRLHLIPHDALVTAFEEWRDGETGGLGEVLLRDEAISEADHQLIQSAVERFLEQFDGDVARALTSLRSIEPTPFEKEVASVVPSSLAQTPRPKPQKVGRLRLPHRTNRSLHRQRYRIVRTIDVTDNCETAIAEDTELRREVALKQVSEARAKNVEIWQRLTREADVLSSLEHPAILPVYSYGVREDGRPYFATRYVRGSSMQEAIRQFHGAVSFDANKQREPIRGLRVWRLRDLLRRFAIACQAVAYAHTRGIVHRDIKPANIMLGQFGETLVVEWGLAKVMYESVVRQRGVDGDDDRAAAVAGSITAPGETVGTLEYLSPEQAQGNQLLVGPASDIYSLGAVLYTLLLGRPPYNPADQKLVTLAREGKFPPPETVDPNIDPRLAAICMKAMSRAIADRYRTAQDLADDVERWLADETTMAPGSFPVRVQRWVKQKSTVLACLAGVFLFGTIAFGMRIAVLETQLENERNGRINDLIALEGRPNSSTVLPESTNTPPPKVVPQLPVKEPKKEIVDIPVPPKKDPPKQQPVPDVVVQKKKTVEAQPVVNKKEPRKSPIESKKQPELIPLPPPKKDAVVTTPPPKKDVVVSTPPPKKDAVVTTPPPPKKDAVVTKAPPKKDTDTKPVLKKKDDQTVAKNSTTPVIPLIKVDNKKSQPPVAKDSPKVSPPVVTEAELRRRRLKVINDESSKAANLVKSQQWNAAADAFSNLAIKFAAENPSGSDAVAYAEVQTQLAEVRQQLKQTPEAIAAAERSLTIADFSRVRGENGEPYKRLRWRSQEVLGKSYAALGKHRQAIEPLKSAAVGWSEEAAKNPSDDQIKERAVNCWLEMVESSYAIDTPADTKFATDKAIELLESDKKAMARSPVLRKSYASALLTRGELLSQRRIHEPAISDLTKAIENSDGRTAAHARYLRAQSYLAMKKLADARKDAIALASNTDADSWFGAAQLFSRLATADRNRENDATRAVEQLQRMKEAGKVTVSQLKSLERMQEFASVRGIPEFKRLLSE